MKLLLLVLVLGYAHRAHGKPSLNQSLVIGGLDVDITVHPSMAKLIIDLSSGSRDCDGTVISVEYILTAAYCLEEVIVIINIIVGHTNVKGVKASYTSLNHRSHPYYKTGSPDYNIGLVKSDKKIDINHNVQIAKLAEHDGLVKVAQMVTVPGWGRWSNAVTSYSDTLKEVKLAAVSAKTCKTAYEDEDIKVTQRNFCANSPTGTKVVCGGDVGSPAIIDRVQVGIVSHVMDCDDVAFPVIFTDVASLRAWIKKEAKV